MARSFAITSAATDTLKAAGTPSTFTVQKPGRFVRVQLVGTNYLSIAEVETMANVVSAEDQLSPRLRIPGETRRREAIIVRDIS